MKKSLLLTLSSAAVISGILFFNSSKEEVTTHKKQIKGTENVKNFSERKKKVKGLMPYDKPDMFDKFHSQIRTKKGQSEPDYKLNYTFSEFQKAKASVGLAKTSNNIVWTERGPGNVSGRTRGIIVDVSDKTHNTWYAGSAGGGIWMTFDAGRNWKEKTFSNLNLATTCLVQAKSNPYIMYAGTGEGFGGGGAIKGNGIFKSVDRGETWKQLESTAGNADFSYINRMVVSPSDQNILLVATNTAILKSVDGGMSWTKVYTGSDKVQQIIADPANFSTLYATEKNLGVLKSTDMGKTWMPATNGISGNVRTEIAIAPSNNKVLYAAVEAGSKSHLYKTLDAGKNWMKINFTGDKDPAWLGSQGWYDNTIAVNPFNENIVFLGGIDTWRADIASNISSQKKVKNVIQDNTNKIFKFINWGGPYAGGGLGKGSDFYDASWHQDVIEVKDTDFTSVEIRFGKGKSQKAYRYVDVGNKTYEYKDFVEVPFEVWDTENNKQLTLSFRDWANNGVFDLIPYDKTNLTREYLSVNAVEYSETEDANLAKNNGMLYKNIYTMWLYATDANSWNPASFQDAKLTIDYGNVESGFADFTKLSYWWKDVKDPLYSHADHHNFTLVTTSDSTFRFIDGNDGGVAYSDNMGKTWVQPTNGFNSTQFYGADKHPAKDEYIGGTQDNGSFKSEIGEVASAKTAYAEVIGGDGFLGAWNNEDPNMVLVGLYYNRLYRNTTNSNNWRDYKSATTGMTDANNRANSAFVTSIDKTKRDGYFLVCTGGSGVWRSDNFGESWTLAQMDSRYYFNTFRTPIAISNADQRVVWAGAANNYIQMSTDGALTFKRVPGYKKLRSYFISGLATHPTDPKTAFMLFSQSSTPKIVKTTDMGQTWTDITGFEGNKESSNGFPNVAVYDLLVMPYNTDIYWACTEIGIFVSENAGKSWKYMNTPDFPAVSVWEANIVGDQVVLATHGRGIWTATIPELADYNMADVYKFPWIKSSTAFPNLFKTQIQLRSVFDSTVVKFDGETVAKLMTDSAVDTTISIPVKETKTVVMNVVSYKNGEEYKTVSQKVNIFARNPVVESYVNDFNDASSANDFSGDFTVATVSGFDNSAIHSGHPYAHNKEHTFILLNPIKVAAENARLYYKDIAIIEPGDPGTKYGDSKFWDYAMVEASKDGITWFDLVDGYDAGMYPEWKTVYAAGGTPNKSLIQSHTIDLLANNNISAGDEIFIRFRLHADANTNGWGWMIDDLSIQTDLVGTKDKIEIPESFMLHQNYPNPFNPTTNIKIDVPKTSKVNLTIFNTLGERVETLLDKEVEAGSYIINWNASKYASGVYFYRFTSDDYVQSKKLMLIK